MATDLDSVAIDRAHFNTLLRMAQFDQGNPTTAPMEPQDLRLITKIEHDKLLLTSRQYANLRANLMSGGVAEETIALLSQDDTSLRQQEIQKFSAKSAPAHHGNGNSADRIRATRKPQGRLAFAPHAQNRTHYHHGTSGESFNGNSDWTDAAEDNYSTSYSPDLQAPELALSPSFGQVNQHDRPTFALSCHRTIMLTGLPDNATHEDITKVVRGGMLLEVYIRSAEHSANVSFLKPEDAARFHDYSRKNDLYIKNRRVFVKWAERHFTLAGHMAGKIARGATRNLVIRRCDSRHTEDSIREDLDHIHNLVVIKVEFLGASCYIKTNSVHNAMFARTCMMSRVKYRGSKVEWDMDECQQPLETCPKPPAPALQCVPSMKKPPVSLRNRFASLGLDSDDSANESTYDSSSEFPVASPVHVSAF